MSLFTRQAKAKHELVRAGGPRASWSSALPLQFAVYFFEIHRQNREPVTSLVRDFHSR